AEPARSPAAGGPNEDIDHAAPLVVQNDLDRIAREKGARPAALPASDQPDAANATPSAVGAKSDGKSPEVASKAAEKPGEPRMLASGVRSAASRTPPAAGDSANPQLAAINRSFGEIHDAGADEKLMPVVKLHVVDHADGLELLQNLLSENNVILTDEAADGLEKGADRGKSKAGAAAGRKEALYVVARPEQVMAAFTAILDRETPAVRLTVEEPIQIAALDADSRKQFEEIARGLNRPSLLREAPLSAIAGADKAVESKKARPSVSDDAEKGAAKTDAKSAPPPAPAASAETKRSAAMRRRAPAKSETEKSQTSRQRPDKPDATAAPEGKDAAAAKRDGEPAAAAQGRQIVVPFPRELEARESRVAAARAAPTPAPVTRKALALPAPPPKSRPEPPREEKTEGEELLRAPSLVRMLIVVERDEPRPAAPAVQPAAGKNPDGKS
ncbi:MAG: hypothetical protein ACM3U2_00645, partial [Deltaproteobacteria bacterium]